LEEQILQRITRQQFRAESGVAINARHRDCLRRALTACDQTSAALAQGISPEYVTVDLRGALDAVGEVLGTIGTEEILDSVFSQFCIGK
jgi:tRNA modification GTPase